MDRQTALEKALVALSKDLGLQSYVSFLQMVKTAIDVLLDSGGQRGRAVDKEHYLFGPILQQSPQAKLIMFMLGFEDTSQCDRSMVLVDFDGHVGMMRLFKDIAEKELATGASGQRRLLDPARSLMSDDPYVVTIHLGYFYFLRFILLTLHTDCQTMIHQGISEQIRVAADAIEMAAKRLHVLQSDGIAHRSWTQCKQQVFAWVDSVGDDGDDYHDLVAAQKFSLSQIFNETANQIANELRLKGSEEFVDVFIFMHLTKHLLSQTNVGQMLFHNDLCEYLRVSFSVRPEYFTEDLMKSVETIRCRITEALDHSLDAQAIDSLHHLVGWQVHSFLDHLKLSRHSKHTFQSTPLQVHNSVSEGGLVQRTQLPTPDQLQAMNPEERLAILSQLVDLRNSLQNSLHQYVTTGQCAGSLDSEMLGEEAAMASSTLIDMQSNAIDNKVDSEDEKKDEDKTEKECFTDEYETQGVETEDEACVDRLSTAAVLDSSNEGSCACTVLKVMETGPGDFPTISHQGYNVDCQIGHDVEELVRRIDFVATFREHCSLVSCAVYLLRQKSTEKEKLLSEVFDLQKSLDLYCEFDVVVDAIKPVWEEKKWQLAVTEVEIEKLKTLEGYRYKWKKLDDIEHEIMAKLLWQILSSANGDSHQLLCLDSAVVRNEGGAKTESMA